MTKLILLVGVPGSGKTTYAKRLVRETPNTTHVSSDAIRKELYGDESVQQNPRIVFEVMHKRTIEFLKAGANVVFDATNLTKRDRAHRQGNRTCEDRGSCTADANRNLY